MPNRMGPFLLPENTIQMSPDRVKCDRGFVWITVSACRLRGIGDLRRFQLANEAVEQGQETRNGLRRQ